MQYSKMVLKKQYDAQTKNKINENWYLKIVFSKTSNHIGIRSDLKNYFKENK